MMSQTTRNGLAMEIIRQLRNATVGSKKMASSTRTEKSNDGGWCLAKSLNQHRSCFAADACTSHLLGTASTSIYRQFVVHPWARLHQRSTAAAVVAVIPTSSFNRLPRDARRRQRALAPKANPVSVVLDVTLFEWRRSSGC
jgi:hypothetical protein